MCLSFSDASTTTTSLHCTVGEKHYTEAAVTFPLKYISLNSLAVQKHLFGEVVAGRDKMH